MAETQPGQLQSYRFLLLYGLAAAGGAIAYVPFLTILLPLRVSDIAGSADIEWLAYLSFAGALAASAANIGFGWLSDITRNRRAWIVAGLISSTVFLLSFPHVESLAMLALLIVAWQLSLNMMLSPLAAWAGDCVPDRQKGLLGGLLAFSPATGALAGALVTLPGLAGAEERLWLVAALVAVCIIPVLIFGAPRGFAELQPAPDHVVQAPQPRPHATRLVVTMWLARVLVQICEATLFAYLFFWFRSVDSAMGEDSVAQLLSIVLICSVPAALLVGRWADLNDRPFLPLAICAGISAIGLFAMALSDTLMPAIGSYILFGLATTVFLSLHTGQILRVLPKPERRGRDLGFFNLSNTAPSLIMPWFVLAMVPLLGFGPLLMLLSGISLIACILLFTIARFR